MRNAPYARLGKKIKELREKHQESLAEMSGALEIDPKMLEGIETGALMPPEEIMDLLCSHFNMTNAQADRLWKMAGYEIKEDLDQPLELPKTMVIVMGIDGRTLYTDSADLSANQTGVTLQFNQQNPNGQSLPIARVGMSYEHAQKLQESLSKVLLYKQYSRPKQLPEA